MRFSGLVSKVMVSGLLVGAIGAAGCKKGKKSEPAPTAATTATATTAATTAATDTAAATTAAATTATEVLPTAGAAATPTLVKWDALNLELLKSVYPTVGNEWLAHAGDKAFLAQSTVFPFEVSFYLGEDMDKPEPLPAECAAFQSKSESKTAGVLVLKFSTAEELAAFQPCIAKVSPTENADKVTFHDTLPGDEKPNGDKVLISVHEPFLLGLKRDPATNNFKVDSFYTIE